MLKTTADQPVKITSEEPLEWSPNQIASWNLRRLRLRAEMTQERLAQLMIHFGIDWTAFTVSDAENAVRRPRRGRRFSADELALLALVFYVTPAEMLVPPTSSDIEQELGQDVVVRVGNLIMSRESYLTDVLLRPSGIAARSVTGALDEQRGDRP